MLQLVEGGSAPYWMSTPSARLGTRQPDTLTVPAPGWSVVSALMLLIGVHHADDNLLALLRESENLTDADGEIRFARDWEVTEDLADVIGRQCAGGLRLGMVQMDEWTLFGEPEIDTCIRFGFDVTVFKGTAPTVPSGAGLFGPG